MKDGVRLGTLLGEKDGVSLGYIALSSIVVYWWASRVELVLSFVGAKDDKTVVRNYYSL